MRTIPGVLFVLAATLALALTPGCGGYGLEALEEKASFDLRCPRERLRWKRLGNGSQGVRGCGRQATYVELCRDFNSDCKWIKDSETQTIGTTRPRPRSYTATSP